MRSLLLCAITPLILLDLIGVQYRRKVRFDIVEKADTVIAIDEVEAGSVGT
jgi:hypothetical protein